MKKIIFYSTILVIAIVLWLAIGFILAIVIESKGADLAYAIGKWCGQPYIILLSIGIALILRKRIYVLTFKTERNFNNNVALCLIVVSILWGAWMLVVNLMNQYSTQELVKTYQNQSQNRNSIISAARSEYQSVAENEPSLNYESSEDEIERLRQEEIERLKKSVEKQYIEACAQLNKQMPIMIDEITSMTRVTFVNWVYTAYYAVDIYRDDYDANTLKEFTQQLRRERKQDIPSMISTGDFSFTPVELYEYLKNTGLKLRFVYTDKNNSQIGAMQFDYRDFKP